MSLRVALAQINPTVGDIAGNLALHRRAAERAADAGADLVVFPELSICGYPPKDLLWQEGFLERCAGAIDTLAGELHGGMTAIVGTPMKLEGVGGSGKSRATNSLVVLRDGARTARYDKRLLPTYDVFDEDRYFEPGGISVVIDVGGSAVGLSVCEDLWRGEDVGFHHHYEHEPSPVQQLAERARGLGTPITLLVNPSASPFVLGKRARHVELLSVHARALGAHVAMVNQVGGNDELIFDGRSTVIGPGGEMLAQGSAFAEDMVVVEIGAAGAQDVRVPAREMCSEEQLYRALVLGVRDYCRKTGFSSAVLGLSGGIDSAVTCVIGAAALGAQHMLGVGLPSRISSEHSRTDARELAERVGVAYDEIGIEPTVRALRAALAEQFAGTREGVAEENIQSRVRGTVLMGISNKHGRLLLTTGNKSELAVGYCTLYGDMNGGLAVLSDVSKTWVYKLARWMNDNPGKLGLGGNTPPIPENTITKPPSAELKEGQVDRDSLPEYSVLDEIIRRYVEEGQSVARVIGETGFDEQVVREMVRLIDLSEYKRKQTAIGLKVTGRAFGSGRRWPIAQGWRG